MNRALIRRHLGLLAVAVPLALATLAASADTITDNIIGNYELFGGSYANTLTGSAALPALNVVASSGTFGFVTTGTAPGWFWSGASSPGTGLTVTGLPANDGVNFGNYSIGMRLALGEVAGYRRLIYFKNSDFGPYVHDGTFRFYDGGFNNPTGGSVTANTTVDFVLTRNAATKDVKAYINGSSTPIFAFNDNSNEAVTAGDRTLQFFRDNGNEFSSSGAAALIRIWNAPLTAADIPTAMTAVVPEPAAATLATIATAGLLLRLRKARHRR